MRHEHKRGLAVDTAARSHTSHPGISASFASLLQADEPVTLERQTIRQPRAGGQAAPVVPQSVMQDQRSVTQRGKTALVVNPEVMMHTPRSAELHPLMQQLLQRWLPELQQEWQGFRFCLSGLSFFVILKGACMLSNLVFQASPYPMVIKIRTDKDTGEVEPAPLIAIALSACQWLFYGTFAYCVTGKSGFLVVSYSNVVGAALGIFYVVSYHLNCKSEESLSELCSYYKLVSGLIVLQAFVAIAFPSTSMLFLSGMIASSCTISAAIAPLKVVPKVLKSQNSDAVPVPVVAACLFSSILWVMCGGMLGDHWIMFPNLFGAACSFYLLTLVIKFPGEDIQGLDRRWNVLRKISEKSPSQKIVLDSPPEKQADKIKAAEGVPLRHDGDGGDIGGTF